MSERAQLNELNFMWLFVLFLGLILLYFDEALKVFRKISFAFNSFEKRNHHIFHHICSMF